MAERGEVNIKVFDLEISIIGDTREDTEVRQYAYADKEQKIYKKIFVKENILCGAVLINAMAQKEKLINLMKSKISIIGVEQQILESNMTIDLFVQEDSGVSQTPLSDGVKELAEAQGGDPSADSSATTL